MGPPVVVPVAGSPEVAATTGTFTGWNIDILFEKNLGDSTGTVTLDGAGSTARMLAHFIFHGAGPTARSWGVRGSHDGTYFYYPAPLSAF